MSSPDATKPAPALAGDRLQIDRLGGVDRRPLPNTQATNTPRYRAEITPRYRAGNATACAVCGKPLTPKRGSRQQRYCSYRCRDEARRARNFAASGATRRGSQAIPRSVENKKAKSTACKGDIRHRASAICAPARVIAREIVAGRDWLPVISPDGVRCMVARIPGLRRRLRGEQPE